MGAGHSADPAPPPRASALRWTARERTPSPGQPKRVAIEERSTTTRAAVTERGSEVSGTKRESSQRPSSRVARPPALEAEFVVR